MVNYCCVPYCKNNALTPGVSSHQIPRDNLLKKKWLVKIRRGSKTSDNMRVCSAHFLPSDYKTEKKRKRKVLKNGAVPSIFAWENETAKNIKNTTNKNIPIIIKDILKTKDMHSLKKSESVSKDKQECDMNTDKNKDSSEMVKVTFIPIYHFLVMETPKLTEETTE